MRRLCEWVAALSVSFGSALSSAATADELGSAIDKIKASVAPVVCLNGYPNRPSADFHGTAFFIDANGTFLTAGHVIADLMQGGALTPCQIAALYIPRDDRWSTPPQDVRWRKFSPSSCTTSSSYDIAMCRIIDDLSKDAEQVFHPVPVTIDDAIQPDGTSIVFSGFPLINPATPVSAIGYVAGYTKDANGLADLIIDRTSWPGAGGSPVYLSNGNVVGMILERERQLRGDHHRQKRRRNKTLYLAKSFGSQR